MANLLANARHSEVLPVPGGPYNRITRFQEITDEDTCQTSKKTK